MSRRLRRVLGVATVAGAMFALPAAAQADATLSFTGQPAGTAVSGDTVNYTLTVAVTADFTGENRVAIETSEFDGTVGAMTVTADAGTNDELVTIDGNEIVLGATLLNAQNDVAVVIPVTMPKRVEPTFHVEAAKASGPDTIAPVNSNDVAVSKGGPSDLRFHVTKIGTTGADALQNKWVKKGTNAAAEVTITNAGTGSAHFVDVSLWIDASANTDLSPTLPNPPNSGFDPQITIAGGACAPTSANMCTIADLAAGASVTIPVTISSITHFGSLDIWTSAQKADTGTNNNQCGNSESYNATTSDCDVIAALDGFDGEVKVTDGSTIEPHVGLLSAARAAAGNTDVSFAGGVSAAGNSIAAGSLMLITSSSYKDNQPVGASYEGDAGVSQSIQSISIPGATCANYVNPTNSKKQLDRFLCTMPAIAANSRLAFSVVAKFATNRKNTVGSVSATLLAPGYAQDGSDTGDSDYVWLNVDKTSDISVVAKSAALVGAGHVAPVDVVITNTGNTKARSISLVATVPGGNGSFGDVEQNVACVESRDGFTERKVLGCGSGELAAGASRTMTIWVSAGTKLGSLPVQISASYLGDGFDLNRDNDWTIQNLTITKKNLVPLLGVKLGKAKAQKMAVAAKSGVKTLVTVPNAANIKVNLRVNAKTAKALGIAKKAKKGKKAPMWYTIGTSVTKTKAAGTFTATTKFGMKYKAKLLKAKNKVVVQRMVTVVSTDRKNAGANSLTSQNLSFTPAKKAKKKPGKR